MANVPADATCDQPDGRLLALGKLEAVLNNFAAAITVPFVVPYAVQIGATGGQIGLITALPLLAFNLAQVPAARWGVRTARLGCFLLLAGGPSRLAWLALALLLLVDSAEFGALLAVVIVASLSAGLLSPVWTAFLAEQVPQDQRGRYFGMRNLMGGAAALPGMFLAAYFVSLSGFTRGSGLALAVSGVALFAALGAQILATSLPGMRGSRPIRGWGAQSTDAWRLPAVRKYVLYGALLVLGAGISTPFYSVYFLNALHGSPEMATTLIAAANTTAMLAQGFWGRVIDRHGLGVVGNLSLGLIALVPLLWLAADDPLLAVPIWLLNGLAWAACNLANFNLVLWISNAENRASVLAWISVLQAPSDFVAPLVGGFLMDRLGLAALFLVSAALRLGAWGAFFCSFTLGSLAGEETAARGEVPGERPAGDGGWRPHPGHLPKGDGN